MSKKYAVFLANMCEPGPREFIIEFKARRDREESLTFPRQAKVKPKFPIQNSTRTRHYHNDGLYLVDPLFLRTAFFEILVLDLSFNPAFVYKKKQKTRGRSGWEIKYD